MLRPGRVTAGSQPIAAPGACRRGHGHIDQPAPIAYQHPWGRPALRLTVGPPRSARRHPGTVSLNRRPTLSAPYSWTRSGTLLAHECELVQRDRPPSGRHRLDRRSRRRCRCGNAASRLRQDHRSVVRRCRRNTCRPCVCPCGRTEHFTSTTSRDTAGPSFARPAVAGRLHDSGTAQLALPPRRPRAITESGKATRRPRSVLSEVKVRRPSRHVGARNSAVWMALAQASSRSRRSH